MRSLLVIALAFGAVSAAAQTPSVIRLPGKTIEVVGLQHWTVQMIQDSMNRYSPGDSLQSNACAAILRYKLHFADAAAIYLPAQAVDSGLYVFVAVVEPQDSARVLFRPVDPRLDTLAIASEWRQGTDIVRHHPVGFQLGIATYLTRSMPAWAAQDSAGLHLMWSFLDAHRTPEDASAARRALRLDPDILDRMVAAAVLLNASDSDSTWWALTDVLLESDGSAKATAGQVLEALAAARPRKVDWRPKAGSLHAILDGTSLFELLAVMDVLTRTGVDPSLATPLLAKGGHAVLAYAGASLAMARLPALRLLKVLRSEDLGADIGKWRAWVDSL